MKWKRIKESYDADVSTFPCIVTDGERVLYIPKVTPSWRLSNYVDHRDIIAYMPIERAPKE